ncbi:MAG: metallophosphoesterase [Actinomycetaceae bacterium]|nr:metallophosphoesterase [Actinomycetaceae bacterium]MDY5854774.1 metallophosphoesterase [Arcanobacterium sp.]
MKGIVWAGVTAGASALATGAVVGAAYAHARHYVLHRRSVLIPRSSQMSGAPGLRILHLSDLHALARHKKLLDFTSHLAMIDPDVIVLTGDLIAHDAAIDPLAEALDVFRGIPGVFVFGSNDYYAPRPRNPLRYLVHNSHGTGTGSRQARKRQTLATASLAAMLTDLGFIDLNNTRATLQAGQFSINAVGVGDAHIGLDEYPEMVLWAQDDRRGTGRRAANEELQGDSGADGYVAGRYGSGGGSFHAGEANARNADIENADVENAVVGNAALQLKIGVAHAPYSRVLDRMAAEGCELIFAGHTHGGQVCLPGHRALVTNCDLPPRLASGMFAWPPNGASPIKKNGAVLVADVPTALSTGVTAGTANITAGSANIVSGTAATPASAPAEFDAASSTSSALAPALTVENDALPVEDVTRAQTIARTWVNVSAGLGTTPFVPLRTWCPPEAIQVDVINM